MLQLNAFDGYISLTCGGDLCYMDLLFLGEPSVRTRDNTDVSVEYICTRYGASDPDATFNIYALVCL